MRHVPALALLAVVGACSPREASVEERRDERAVDPAVEPAPAPLVEVAAPLDDGEATTVEAQREQLYAALSRGLGVSDEQVAVVRQIVEGGALIGHGNPAISRHPQGRAACRAIRAEAGGEAPPSEVCGAPHMAPLFDGRVGETAADARVCIDRFEFPGVPCEYPLVYARANEAAALCQAVGKRLCDAHEWEGACAGALDPPAVAYDFTRDRLQGSYRHNQARDITWAWGKDRDAVVCGTNGGRSASCTGEWSKCATQTWPAGSFPACKSAFGVYDLHGNAAEHMSHPGSVDELGGKGSTEMKGSWFGFLSKVVHPDDCRWRAPEWHVTRVDNPNSHRNYHLGFRCCLDVGR